MIQYFKQNRIKKRQDALMNTFKRIGEGVSFYRTSDFKSDDYWFLVGQGWITFMEGKPHYLGKEIK